jgi:type III secretion system YscJ/HrcJ family lipoprotein
MNSPICDNRRVSRYPIWATSMSQVMGAVVLVLLLLALYGCDERTALVSHLAPRDAYEIQSVLADADIHVVSSPDKDDHVDIFVDAADEASARRILKQHSLPRPSFETLGDVFGKDSLISSPFEVQARYLYATSQGLEDTLRNIDGVVFAKVHIVLPEKKSLVHRSATASASVFIKFLPDSNVAALTPSIQRLIANAIPDVPVDRVEVIAIPAVSEHGKSDSQRLEAMRHLNGESADGMTGVTWQRLAVPIVFIVGGLVGSLGAIVAAAFGLWLPARVSRSLRRGLRPAREAFRRQFPQKKANA